MNLVTIFRPDKGKYEEIYSYELHPFLTKVLGVTRVCRNSVEFKWGYISFNSGPELMYDYTYEYGVPRISLCLIWLAFHIELPFIKARYDDVNYSPQYGIVYHNKCLWFHWHLKCWTLHMPWDWEHYSHKVWSKNGWIEALAPTYRTHKDVTYHDDRIVENYPYKYRLKDGTVQFVNAEIFKERREWRWYYFSWLPFPRLVQESIDVRFDGEVGEGVHVYKGGTLGCAYPIRPDETMFECLKRMEKERTF